MNLREIPKVELHRHLEGALRWSTLRDVARTLRKDLPPSEQALREFALVLHPMPDLKSLLDRFDLHQSILSSPEILERISFEACEDAFQEGIRVLELRYAPSFIQMNHTLSFEQIHQAIVKGLKRATDKYEMAVGLIGILVRTEPLTMAERVTDFIIENKNTFIGIDLASDEVGFDCQSFAPCFNRARQAGLRITIHAGEANYPGAAQAVEDSIVILGAERIGHGLQIIKSPKTIELVKKNNVTLELCPVSNELTSTGFNRKNHPIADLRRQGVKVTLNSDDPGLFGTDLTTDYQAVSSGLGFDLETFRKLNQTAFDASFIPAPDLERFRDLFFS